MTQIVAKGFVLAGIALLAVGGWTGKRQYTIMTQWPAVEAEVAESRVVQGVDSDGAMMYSAAIQFRYSVNGKEYLTPASSNVRTTSYASVKRQVDRYSAGTRHSIRHNPTDPNEVYFDAGYNLNFFFLPVFFGGMGIAFAGIGIAILVSTRRRLQANEMSVLREQIR